MMIVMAVMFILSVLIVPSSILIRPDYILLAMIVGVSLIANVSSIFRLSRIESYFIIILTMLAVVSVFGQVLFGGTFIVKDLMVAVRYLVYLLAIYAGISLGLKTKNIVIIRFVTLLLAVFAVLLSFMQYFNVAGINNFIVPIYGFQEKYETLQAGASWRRIIGTMGNPNYWGFVLGIITTTSLYLAFKKKYIYYVLASFGLISIVMTGSRTSLVATIVTVGAAFALILLRGRRSIASVVGFVLLFGVVSAASVAVSSYFTNNYYESEGRFSVSNLDTLHMRLAWWKGIYAEMVEVPYTFIIGRGPSKLESIRFGDNMYIRYVRDFGIFALIIYLSFVRRAMQKMNSIGRVVGSQYGVLGDIVLLAFCFLLVFDMAADGWFNVRIIELLLFGYGLILGLNYGTLSKNGRIDSNT